LNSFYQGAFFDCSENDYSMIDVFIVLSNRDFPKILLDFFVPIFLKIHSIYFVLVLARLINEY